ncbi:solute carrier family 22 member 13-like isoform X1 [Mya arenaria]|uniref:solute carrier family 22 member 13-like isoform X1 n=2 Tax=Mya arenaria TaxID=6604 RepID=UPI0022DEDAF6|nr:solute carrier family 22 member 13-like isoform X1 [Mya arenaria]
MPGPETPVDIEELLNESGGCGRYQILLTLIIHFSKFIVCFTQLFMVFGGATPKWRCIEGMSENATLLTNGTDEESCYVTVNGVSKQCEVFSFNDDMNTAVSQFSLVCGREWISSTITSIQMAGIFVGNIACGQVADLIGRKKPFFGAILTLVVLNIGTAFSVSWVMFAVFRFLLGVAMGFQLTVQYNLVAEFTLAKWRTWVVAIPSWAIESSVFGLVCWALKDLFWIHIVTAAVGCPFLFTYWFVPESFRWYIGHDKTDKAKKIVSRIAEFNGKGPPKSIELIGGGQLMDKKDRTYHFLDLFRDRTIRLYTCLLIFVWISLGLTGYGIQFGVPKLSGNLFVNMFVLGLASSPVQFICIWLQNRLGRKKTTWLFYGLGAVAAFVVATAGRFPDGNGKDWTTNVFAIIALTLVYAVWSPIQTFTMELYPTVVRNLGYGTQNTMARIGAIIGPQLVYLETMFEGSLYWISGTVAVIAMFLIIPIPETSRMHLADKIVPITDELLPSTREKAQGVELTTEKEITHM